MKLLHRFKKKTVKDPVCDVVVAAAGSSRRMGDSDKLFIPIAGKPVLAHTLSVLEECPYVRRIVIVTREDSIPSVGKLCKEYCFTKVSRVITGGETRSESVYAGLCSVPDDCELVAIHDGARPFVTGQVLDEVIRCAAKTGAAAPAVPVKDTIKRSVDGVVTETPNREELFAVQTPQVFEHSLIKAALYKAIQERAELTDDCSAVERVGMKVHLTQGSEENIKITTPIDVQIGESILAGRAEP